MLYNLRYVALGAVAAVTAAATVAAAQGVPPPAPPSPQAGEHRGMNMDGRHEMTRTMDNCNRMMESFLRKPQTPTAPEPENKPKG